jgi:5-methylcytosine-specific restriction protein A
MIDSLQPGEKIDNERLCEIFKCSPQGGMRRSLKTNSLILVSNHVSSIYEDRWVDDALYYTGMGASGNQSLEFMQNKTLFESASNKVNLYLFEIFKDKEYTYTGTVYLAEEPFTEKQLDGNLNERDVFVFKLKLLNGTRPLINHETISTLAQEKDKRTAKRSDQEIAKRASKINPKAGFINTSIKQFIRNPFVSEYAKRLAKGKCMLCHQDAPFLNSNGLPYLETHHIQWLSQGGEDSINNTVALCPNCHRKMHIVNSKSDIEYLKQIIKTKLIPL